MTYADFLATKRAIVAPVGFDVPPEAFSPILFAFQRDIARWSLRKGRCAIFADCVSGDTIIQSPDGDERIDVLAERNKPIRVWSVNEEGEVVIAHSTSPFRKGVAPQYRFTLEDGKSITVTEKHRFLTPEGWCYAGELQPGRRLAVSVPCHPLSTEVVSPLMSQPSACDCQKTPLNFQGRYSGDYRQYDEPLLQGADSALALAPLQVGVLERAGLSLRGGDQEQTPAHNHLRQNTFRPSTLDSSLPAWSVSDDVEYRLLSSASKSGLSSNHTVQRVLPSANLAQSIGVSHPLAVQPFEGVQSEAFEVSFRTLVSIDYITTDEYFDLHVPGYENYLANGFVNHNTGLGKTIMQLEWARLVAEHTGKPVLVLAPLSVARQTVREALGRLGVKIDYIRSMDAVTAGQQLYITNYEMLEHFDSEKFGGVVLDESSILKNLDGKLRHLLTSKFADTPYRLCCTATPAPNDITEIGRHAEFLGIMSNSEMLAAFFINDMKQKDGVYRLKRHAVKPFYRWLSSWGIAIKKPSDLGYADDGYNLPGIDVSLVTTNSDYTPEGMMPGFFVGDISAADAHKVRRQTMTDRIAQIATLVNADTEQWVIWTGLNDEADAVTAAIPGAVNVQGSLSPDAKADAIEAFVSGKTRVLVTKTSIAGFGINMQNCHQMLFCGIDYSWESYYQAVRRCYRFGQTEVVRVVVVTSEQERPIFDVVMRKEAEAVAMTDELIRHAVQYEKEELMGIYSQDWTYQTADRKGDDWHLMLGDSVERINEIPDNSIDLSVYSPPFISLYTYTPTERDMGNSKDSAEFFDQYGYIIDGVLRITKPGRNTCVHVQQVAASKVNDGYIGIKDFRGDVIRAYIAHGWTFYGEVTIDKNPQVQAIRTKAKGLMFQQLHKDSVANRPAFGDYILIFQKPGENKVPVIPDVTNEEWIEWAHPVWYGIRESDTLNVAVARSDEDERHMCPLQLPVIERCIRLYSNPGETVFSPFAGIGSELVTAIKHHRKAIGIELKQEYFDVAAKYLTNAAENAATVDLFTYNERIATS